MYFDNAATTQICDAALEQLTKMSKELFYNPSAVYRPSIFVAKEIDNARQNLAKQMNVPSSKIFFTSGGTEGANWAVFSSCTKHTKEIACSACEHPAVYEAVNSFSDRLSVSFLPCKSDGSVDITRIPEFITAKTDFVSVMHVNNETGAINDIYKIAAIVKKIAPKCIFHSDGVQAFCKLPVDLSDPNIDFYSASSHKINGPKGCGFLYAKNPNQLKPLIHGGGQERGLRSGTENVAAITAFSAALSDWMANRSAINKQMCEIKDYLIKGLQSFDGVHFNSDINRSAPHILNVSFDGIKGEVLLHKLEEDGILIGLGSACSARHKLSRALRAMNITSEGTVRISFGRFNTIDKAVVLLEKIKLHVTEIRSIMRRETL